MWLHDSDPRPGLDEDFQQRAFREVRAFFDAPRDFKKTAHIANSPYFRGYTVPTPADRGHGQVIENFQYGFEQPPLAPHDDPSVPSLSASSKDQTPGPMPTPCPAFGLSLRTLTIATIA